MITAAMLSTGRKSSTGSICIVGMEPFTVTIQAFLSESEAAGIISAPITSCDAVYQIFVTIFFRFVITISAGSTAGYDEDLGLIRCKILKET